MFSSLGLFKTLPCPDFPKCSRNSCLFSHQSQLPPPPSLIIPVQSPLAVVPSKRPVSLSPRLPTPDEPPRKFQKLSPQQKSLAIPSPSHTNVSGCRVIVKNITQPPRPNLKTGVPVLRINAAQSQIPVPVRQVGFTTF